MYVLLFAPVLAILVGDAIRDQGSDRVLCEDSTCETENMNNDITTANGRTHVQFQDSIYLEGKDDCIIFTVTSYLKQTANGYLLEDEFQAYEPALESDYASFLVVNYGDYRIEVDQIHAQIKDDMESLSITGYICERNGKPVESFLRQYEVQLSNPIKVKEIK